MLVKKQDCPPLHFEKGIFGFVGVVNMMSGPDNKYIVWCCNAAEKVHRHQLPQTQQSTSSIHTLSSHQLRLPYKVELGKPDQFLQKDHGHLAVDFPTDGVIFRHHTCMYMYMVTLTSLKLTISTIPLHS